MLRVVLGIHCIRYALLAPLICLGTAIALPSRAALPKPKYHKLYYGSRELDYRSSRGPVYNIATFLPALRLPRSIGVEELIQEAHRWGINRYREEYPELQAKEPAIFDALESDSSLLNRKSIMVVAYEGGPLGRIVATLRANFPSSRGEALPGEALLGSFRFPRRKIRVHFFPDDPEGMLFGNIIELKNFVKASDLKEDLFPVLLTRLIQALLDLTTVQARLNQLEPVLEQLPQTYLAKVPPSLAAPEDFVLVCHRRMSHYYERLGFRKVVEIGDQTGWQLDEAGFWKLEGRAFDRMEVAQFAPLISSPPERFLDDLDLGVTYHRRILETSSWGRNKECATLLGQSLIERSGSGP